MAVVARGLQSSNSMTKLDVANHGLRAIGNLAYENAANQTQLGEHGAAAGALALLAHASPPLNASAVQRCAVKIAATSNISVIQLIVFCSW